MSALELEYPLEYFLCLLCNLSTLHTLHNILMILSRNVQQHKMFGGGVGGGAFFFFSKKKLNISILFKINRPLENSSK